MKAHITGTDASPSAQKAAGEIFTKANIELPDASGYRYDTEIAASIIQQAITEAVDAAVASQKARYDALARKWQEQARDTAVHVNIRDNLEACAQELLVEGEK